MESLLKSTNTKIITNLYTRADGSQFIIVDNGYRKIE